MRVNEATIREHLPKDLPEEALRGCFNFGELYLKGLRGLTVMATGERGLPDYVVYEASDREDLLLWQFEQVCYRIASSLELKYRRENEKKWRYVRDHAENNRWFYVERRNYVYNAVEDSRLYTFETYLRLLKPVLPPQRWEKTVVRHTSLMNRWYKAPHWAYDRNSLAFIEISDSMEYCSDSDDSDEIKPDSVIRVIE